MALSSVKRLSEPSSPVWKEMLPWPPLVLRYGAHVGRRVTLTLPNSSLAKVRLSMEKEKIECIGKEIYPLHPSVVPR